MDPFVRRLVERLLDASKPLSRNRHFHTFETPEGKRALRVWKRLLALQRDIELAREEGGSALVLHQAVAATGEVTVKLELHHLKTTRTATLEGAEFDLLCQLPGVREALRDG
jgi:hypothetical protein